MLSAVAYITGYRPTCEVLRKLKENSLGEGAYSGFRRHWTTTDVSHLFSCTSRFAHVRPPVFQTLRALRRLVFRCYRDRNTRSVLPIRIHHSGIRSAKTQHFFIFLPPLIIFSHRSSGLRRSNRHTVGDYSGISLLQNITEQKPVNSISISKCQASCGEKVHSFTTQLLSSCTDEYADM